MALSNFLIRPPTEAQQGQVASQRRAAPATGGASFAAVMQGQARQAEGPAQLPQPAQAMSGQEPPATLAGMQAPARNLVLAGRSPSDLMRAQVFGKAEADLRQTQAIEGLMQSVSGNGSTLDLARSMGAARQLHSLSSTVGERLGGLNGGDFIHSRPSAPGQGKTRQKRLWWRLLIF